MTIVKEGGKGWRRGRVLERREGRERGGKVGARGGRLKMYVCRSKAKIKHKLCDLSEFTIYCWKEKRCEETSQTSYKRLIQIFLTVSKKILVWLLSTHFFLFYCFFNLQVYNNKKKSFPSYKAPVTPLKEGEGYYCNLVFTNILILHAHKYEKIYWVSC